MLRTVTCFLVFGAASSVFASFEMALTLQYIDTPGNPGTKIARWDPVNGIYLGGFTAFGMTPSAKLFLDPNQGNIVTGATLSSGLLRLLSFDYNTGIMQGSTTLATPGTSLNSIYMLTTGSYIVTGSGAGGAFARLLGSGGNTLRNYALPAGTTDAVDIQIDDTGVVHILTRQNGTSSGNRWTLSSYAASQTTAAASVVVVDNSSDVVTNMVRYGNTMVVCTTNTTTRRLISVDGTTLGTPSGTFAGIIGTSAKSVKGHGDLLHAFGYNTTSNRMQITSMIYDISSGSQALTYGSPFGEVYDAVIVVAPEPGTLLALGVGGLALLRRRRARG